MNELARKKLTKARAALVLDHPFFGSLALRLRLQEDPTCKAAWVDGKTMGYNPDFVEAADMPIIKTMLAHEVMHCVALHPFRRDKRDMKKWNSAADYAINDILANSGFEPIEGWLHDPAYADMAAEHVYTKLPSEPGNDGGGEEGEANDNDPGGCGEVRDAPGQGGEGENEAPQPTPSELREMEEEWKVATSQAAQQAKTMGNLPGDIARMIDEVLNPKADWRSILRQFMEHAAKNDYTWTRPNRRFIHQNLYLPSAYSQELGEIVVGIDTSGSINQEQLKEFSSELSSILEELRPEKVHIVYCDTRVTHTETFTSDDLPLKISAKGGGGTSFRPVFEWVEQQGIDPVCLIYMTDLYSDSFPETPHYPTLWATDNPQLNPPFGDNVDIS